jgi:hypothetical protein
MVSDAKAIFLRGFQRSSQLLAVLACDMGNHEEIAAVEPDIERQDLRIDAQHAPYQR